MLADQRKRESAEGGQLVTHKSFIEAVFLVLLVCCADEHLPANTAREGLLILGSVTGAQHVHLFSCLYIHPS